jgi:hypothetical protein
MKTEKIVGKVRAASLFFRRSSIKCSSSKLLIMTAILSIAILYPAMAHSSVSTASTLPNSISPPCQNHMGTSNGNACYPIFSPRLNVPISPSSVTGEISQPRPVGLSLANSPESVQSTAFTTSVNDAVCFYASGSNNGSSPVSCISFVWCVHYYNRDPNRCQSVEKDPKSTSNNDFVWARIALCNDIVIPHNKNCYRTFSLQQGNPTFSACDLVVIAKIVQTDGHQIVYEINCNGLLGRPGLP